MNLEASEKVRIVALQSLDVTTAVARELGTPVDAFRLQRIARATIAAQSSSVDLDLLEKCLVEQFTAREFRNLLEWLEFAWRRSDSVTRNWFVYERVFRVLRTQRQSGQSVSARMHVLLDNFDTIVISKSREIRAKLQTTIVEPFSSWDANTMEQFKFVPNCDPDHDLKLGEYSSLDATLMSAGKLTWFHHFWRMLLSQSDPESLMDLNLLAQSITRDILKFPSTYILPAPWDLHPLLTYIGRPGQR